MSKGWAGGSTRAWRKYRRTILDRDGWQCLLKLDGRCRTIATEVHHLDGVRAGLMPEDTTRCIAACQPCNGAAGDPTANTPPPNPPTTRWD
jgi:5-methylcytosine-specific restriction endonuclease McrA